MAEHDAARPQEITSAARAVGTDLDLYRAYTAEEAAQWIGCSRDAVYKIPESLLRPTRTGPAGGSKRFLGINILCYLTGQEPVDVEEIGRQVRESFIARAAQPSTVRPMPGLRGTRQIL